MNKVQLLGRLVKDPELRYSSGETPLAICNYTLAVNKKKQGEANFINCVAFGKSAEFAEKYFSKGQQIAIIGSLEVSNWNDDQGNKKFKTEVNVEEQFFAGSNTKSSTNENNE